jgi:hypothetical protein
MPGGWILSDHNARAKRINNPDELTAETLVNRVMVSRSAVFLTRVASADDIDSPIFGGRRRKGSHVVPLAAVRPVSAEDLLAERVDFNAPSFDKASPFKSQ